MRFFGRAGESTDNLMIPPEIHPKEPNSRARLPMLHHLRLGWRFPRSALRDFTEQLLSKREIIIHPFRHPPDAPPSEAGREGYLTESRRDGSSSRIAAILAASTSDAASPHVARSISEARRQSGRLPKTAITFFLHPSPLLSPSAPPPFPFNLHTISPAWTCRPLSDFFSDSRT